MLQTVYSESPCPIDGADRQIVLSRPGGFVTQDCTECGNSKTLALWDIPPVRCPKCSALVTVGMGGKKNRNYVGRCSCGHFFLLGDIVPYWVDAGYPRCGVAAPGDESFRSHD